MSKLVVILSPQKPFSTAIRKLRKKSILDSNSKTEIGVSHQEKEEEEEDGTGEEETDIVFDEELVPIIEETAQQSTKLLLSRNTKLEIESLELRWQLEERFQLDKQKSELQQRIMASDWERYMEITQENEMLKQERKILLSALSEKEIEVTNLSSSIESLEIQNLSFVDEDESFLRKYSNENLNSLQTRVEQVSTKSHLVQREMMRRLEEEKSLLKNTVSSCRDDKLCVICQDLEKDVLFLPCKHICVCNNCKLKLEPYRCPMCKTDIRSYLQKIHF